MNVYREITILKREVRNYKDMAIMFGTIAILETAIIAAFVFAQRL